MAGRKGVQRYILAVEHLLDGGGAYMEKDDSGPWVAYEDYAEVMARAEAAEARLEAVARRALWVAADVAWAMSERDDIYNEIFALDPAAIVREATND